MSTLARTPRKIIPFQISPATSGRCARQVGRTRASCPFGFGTRSRARWLAAWDRQDAIEKAVTR